MKKIWKMLKLHVSEDFILVPYLLVAVLTATLLLFNYTCDFEDSFLDQLKGIKKFAIYLIFYSVPYYVVLFIISDKEKDLWWKSKEFYLRSLFALVLVSLDSSLPFLNVMLSSIDSAVRFWTYKVTVNMISLFTVFIPLLLFYLQFDRSRKNLYGLTPNKVDYKPYVIILLLMLVPLVAASFQASFLKQYPMYKTSTAHLYLGTPEWFTVLVYEIAYGLDFITVELLFRGFMILGLSAFIGRKSVLAMSIVYCMLHFGKPPAEAISSIFGGYVLGVIAYETKSIWGGIIVHIGIAWMMECLAYLQKHIP